MNDFESQHQVFGYERDDQNQISFNANNMLISLCYTYDSDWRFNGSYTSFSIENQRDYPELYIDKNYESNIEVSSYIELNGKISAPKDYKRKKRIKRRPHRKESKSPVIWMDNKNSKIGFADLSFSQVFVKEEIENLTLQNVRPAKGSGGAYLSVKLKDKSRSTFVLGGSFEIFNLYIEHIENLTGKTVVLAPEYDDI